MRKSLISMAIAGTALAAHAQSAQDRFVGDVGVLVGSSSAVVQGQGSVQTVMPYVYGDWGRFYARVDTVGARVLPLGHGHLELSARLGMAGVDGRKTAWPQLNDRGAPLPVGLGTFQATPVGGVFAYLMHESRSGGQLAELNWAGRVVVGPVTLYPQLGAQYQSASLVQHLYGLSAAQAAQTGLSAYQAAGGWSPMAKLHATLPLAADWSLQLNLRRTWLGKAVTQSPLVEHSSQNAGFLALTHSFN